MGFKTKSASHLIRLNAHFLATVPVPAIHLAAGRCLVTITVCTIEIKTKIKPK